MPGRGDWTAGKSAHGQPVAVPGDREKSLAAGANDYVTEPVDTDELLARLERWLSGR